MSRSNVLAGLELDLERSDERCRVEGATLYVVYGESAAN